VLVDALPYLRCPVCFDVLTPAAGAVRCPRGHAYDVARQGYVNLLRGGRGTSTADTAQMVAARAAFLEAGHFAGIATRVRAAAGAVDAQGCVVDLGAGTGYYLARVLDAGQERVGVALDLSKHAARRAARAHPRIGAAVCDTWVGVPVCDGAASVVLDIFAPRNGAEMARILARGGRAIVVTPTARHLRELVDRLGLLSVDARKPERVADQLEPFLSLVDDHAYEQALRLGADTVEQVVWMGPSAWHTDASSLGEAIAGLGELVTVTVSVRVTAWERR